MKLIALAAALALTAPALAQTAPQTTTAPAADVATDAAAPADQSMTTTAAPAETTATNASAPVDEPVGGYQPSTPALSGQPQPGQTVTFQQAPSPSEAFPAPAPMDKYPLCKKGQYDNCRQRGGK